MGYSYVHYLKSRLAYLKSLLANNNIPLLPAEAFPNLTPPPPPPSQAPTTASFPPPPIATANSAIQLGTPPQQLLILIDPVLTADEPVQGVLEIERKVVTTCPENSEVNQLDNLMSDICLLPFSGASDPRYLGSTSGISFASIMFAAVTSSTSGANSDLNRAGGEGGSLGPREFRPRIGSSTRIKAAQGLGIAGPRNELAPDDDKDTKMGSLFFGLHTKLSIIPAPFLTRKLAERLVNLYFQYVNPQIPILHTVRIRWYY